jgi:hypothetical protein
MVTSWAAFAFYSGFFGTRLSKKCCGNNLCDSIRDSPTYRVHQKPAKGFAKIFADFGILEDISRKYPKRNA